MPEKTSREFWRDVLQSRLPDVHKHYQSEISLDWNLEMLEDNIDAVSDMLASMRARRNTLAAPVMILPSELLGRIFSLAASQDRPHLEDCARMYMGWINATHVCRRWRHTALSDTTLWKNVDLSNLAKPWSVEMLRRSSPGPLALTTTLRMPDEVKSSLEAGDISRLQSLTVCDDFLAFFEGTALEQLLCHRTHPVPLLQSLKVVRAMPLNDDLDMPLSLFSSESRQLRSISLHNCSLHWDSTHLPNLVHLHVSSSRPMTPINPIPTAQQLSHMFHGLPQLESLELIDVLRGDPRITPGLQDPIVLPSLTRLKLDFVSPHWSEFIASITAPSLVNSYITFTALPRTLSSSLMHFGKHLRIPRALSVELVPESETPTISEPPNFDCGLRISSAPDAHSWLLLPLGENDPVRAVDAVMDQLWRGLDFSHLRTLSLSFRAHEAWSPERWTAVFGDARGVTGVTAVGRCAADSLTDALATRRPDVLFPALARVELSGSARETDVLAGALRRALRARGERTLQSVCGPGPAEHTDSWTVRTVWTGAIIAERSSQPVLQAEL